MIQLIGDLVLMADEHCYIVGKPRQRRGRPIELKEPKYYSTAAQAVRGALAWAMRQAVADGDIITLRQFVGEQERLKMELEKLLAQLES